MELGVPLESAQGSQASSGVETCTSALLPYCSSSVKLLVELTKGSVAFPGNSPTGMLHMPLWFESIPDVTVEQV